MAVLGDLGLGEGMGLRAAGRAERGAVDAARPAGQAAGGGPAHVVEAGGGPAAQIGQREGRRPVPGAVDRAYDGEQGGVVGPRDRAPVAGKPALRRVRARERRHHAGRDDGQAGERRARLHRERRPRLHRQRRAREHVERVGAEAEVRRARELDVERVLGQRQPVGAARAEIDPVVGAGGDRGVAVAVEHQRVAADRDLRGGEAERARRALAVLDRAERIVDPPVGVRDLQQVAVGVLRLLAGQCGHQISPRPVSSW